MCRHNIVVLANHTYTHAHAQAHRRNVPGMREGASILFCICMYICVHSIKSHVLDHIFVKELSWIFHPFQFHFSSFQIQKLCCRCSVLFPSPVNMHYWLQLARYLVL